MEIHADVKAKRKLIEGSIKKFGYAPEHNYHHFVYQGDDKNKCYFFHFGDYKGILARLELKTNIWNMLSGVLAPKEERIKLFARFLDYAFDKENTDKVVVEVGKDFRKEIINKLKNTKYRVCGTNYCLYWPVYDVASLNSRLPGKKWKKLRNIKNRFNKKFRIAFRDAKKINNGLLNEVLSSWLKRRPHNDRVEVSYYKNAIKNNFEGFSVAKSIYINGAPCSISSGWAIPNSNNIYYGIGIQNYRYNNMAELANLNDLMTAKNKGYEHVDLGGSDKTLLFSKRKLKPQKIYKSYVFSIVKKE